MPFGPIPAPNENPGPKPLFEPPFPFPVENEPLDDDWLPLVAGPVDVEVAPVDVEVAPVDVEVAPVVPVPLFPVDALSAIYLSPF